MIQGLACISILDCLAINILKKQVCTIIKYSNIYKHTYGAEIRSKRINITYAMININEPRHGTMGIMDKIDHNGIILFVKR